jgi:hypothetical protein
MREQLEAMILFVEILNPSSFGQEIVIKLLQIAEMNAAF